MGQAKQRQLRESAFLADLNSKVNIEQLAKAMQKLATAASGSLGADCYMHAALPQVILQDHGVPARITVGFASWRIGQGDGDVISHAPMPGAVQFSKDSGRAAPYHVWLTLKQEGLSWVLDFTTYQLAQKAADLDAMDGGKTTVAWCPDFLLRPAGHSSSLAAVAKGDTGLFHYEENAQLSEVILANSIPVDPMDVSTLRIIYANPDIYVQGPNDMPPD